MSTRYDRWFRAVESNNIELLKNLLAQGIDVNYRSKNTYLTALSHAVDSGYTEIVALLLDHGASVNTQDDIGETPLDKAMFAGYREIVEMLMHHGADAHKPDYYEACKKRKEKRFVTETRHIGRGILTIRRYLY